MTIKTFINRIICKIRKAFSLWHSLLATSLTIMVYLIALHLGEAISYSSMALYFNHETAHISWPPSKGEVDHYLLEITNARFLSSNSGENVLTRVEHIYTSTPFYQFRCEHNHSYRVRVKAISPSGIASNYSEPSKLFICDREKPEIILSDPPSPQKVRSSVFHVTGSYKEHHLSSIMVNGTAVSVDPINEIFKAKVTLEPGMNDLTVVAQDLAGNTTTRHLDVHYAPLTIHSIPSDAKIYWNGNYAYSGMYSGNTPQSFNQIVSGKQVLRLTFPGFNDYYGIIDSSDLVQDEYIISLFPATDIVLQHVTPIPYSQEELAIGRCSYPFVVDYDLDARKDLLVGTADGTIALFTNSGTESNPTFKGYNLLKVDGEDIDVGTHAAPFMADINNDGVSDLLVGNGDGYLFYYVNRGDHARPIFRSPIMLEDAEGMTIAVDGHCTPCVVDWNEDHKKDLLLGSDRGTLVVYLNQGSDSDPEFSSPYSIEAEGTEFNVGSFAAPFVADWNNDGKKDLLVGDGGGYVHLYLNHSKGVPHLTQAGNIQLDGQDLVVEGSAVPFLVDWNQDGKRELLVGCRDGFIYLFK